MIHFDAHADTGDIQLARCGARSADAPADRVGRAARRSVPQVGLRGYWPGRRPSAWMAAQNMRSYEMTEIGTAGLGACLDEAFGIALDE